MLINIDTELGAKHLLNNRIAYVAVSRGAQDAQIFTDSRRKLPQALGRDVPHASAHVPELRQEAVPETRRSTDSQDVRHQQAINLGLGLGM